MKCSIFFCLVFTLSLSSTSQTFFENFENYATRSPLCSQSTGLWTTSDGLHGGAQDVMVTNEQSYSGENSIVFTNASTSVLLPLNVNKGVWELTFKMRIESGYTGSFRLIHRPVDNETNTAFHASFSEIGVGLFNAAHMLRVNFPHPIEEWFDVRLKVNLDKNKAWVFLNERSMLLSHLPPESPWAWALGDLGLDSTLTALQFSHYPENKGHIKYFIDDVGFRQTNLKLDEVKDLVRIHPNPTRNNMVINASELDATTCEIHSFLGNTVLKAPINSDKINVDCSGWDPGLYFIRLRGGKKSWQSKFIVE